MGAKAIRRRVWVYNTSIAWNPNKMPLARTRCAITIINSLKKGNKMKRLITICITAGLVVFTTSLAYAALPSDNFNDNSMDTSLWSIYEKNPSKAWLDETNRRLEMRSTEPLEILHLHIFLMAGVFLQRTTFHSKLIFTTALFRRPGQALHSAWAKVVTLPR